MTDSIDIHDPILEICNRLGIKPDCVQDLHFTPTQVIATVFLENENGAKYLVDAPELLPSDDPEAETSGPFHQVPATKILRFEVTT